MAKLRVRLNGTGTNPFEKMGLTQNPFPQLARAECMAGETALNRLAAEPIPHNRYEEHIRAVLRGVVSEELAQLCVDRFEPGIIAQFTVEF